MPGKILSSSDKTIGISISQCVRMIATTVVIEVCISYCWNILILYSLYLQVYPLLVATLGYPGVFACHALSILVAGLFVVMFLPETRNKSLSQIQTYFKSK